MLDMLATLVSYERELITERVDAALSRRRTVLCTPGLLPTPRVGSGWSA